MWALAVDGNEVLVAGGGERGATLILAREGGSRKLADLPEETAFTCLAADGRGGCYLGSHGRGLLLHYTGVRTGDRMETLMATGFEEVRALAVDDGQVYVGATNGLSGKFSSGVLEHREGYLAEVGTGPRSAVIRLDADRVPQTLWQTGQSQIFALTVWNGQLLVGTGNRSRLFAIPLAETARALSPFSALDDLGTAQATAFLHVGTDLLVVGSNPAELHLLGEAQATEGTIDSRILKGAPMADWGRAYLEADTPSGTSVTLQARTGATEIPDGTWIALDPAASQRRAPRPASGPVRPVPAQAGQHPGRRHARRGERGPALGQPQPGPGLGGGGHHAPGRGDHPQRARPTTSASSGCPWRPRS